MHVDETLASPPWFHTGNGGGHPAPDYRRPRGTTGAATMLVVIANVALIGAAVTTGALAARRRREGSTDDAWPAFWFAVALVAGLMAVGRTLDLGELVADAGRRQARESGWYDSRTAVQAGAVGAAVIGVAVLVTAGARRRRGRLAPYVPTAALAAVLAAYSAIRIVSLHDVDQMMNRTGFGGIVVESAVEFVLLVATTVAVLHYLWGLTARGRPGERTVTSPKPRSS